MNVLLYLYLLVLQEGFEAVGGHEEAVAMLKEMVLLPLMYPDMYDRLGITPPRGMLFHGPPGTGKTLMARALAGALAKASPKPVAFFARKVGAILMLFLGRCHFDVGGFCILLFPARDACMRQGADCLGKFSGEAERTLRLLFEEVG